MAPRTKSNRGNTNEESKRHGPWRRFLIGFPLFPMGSVRLRDLGSEGIPFFKRTTNYEFIEDVPLDILQVLRTCIYSVFIVAWFGHWAFGNQPPLVRFIMITLGILLPFGLRFFSRRLMQ